MLDVPLVTSAMTCCAVRVPALLTAAVLCLSACSSSSNNEGSADGSGTDASTSPSPGSTTSNGVELTDQGARLDFGQSATVAHRAAGESSVLRLSVKSPSRAL